MTINKPLEVAVALANLQLVTHVQAFEATLIELFGDTLCIDYDVTHDTSFRHWEESLQPEPLRVRAYWSAEKVTRQQKVRIASAFCTTAFFPYNLRD